MSNRLHNKWHRHNHHTNYTPNEPDSAHDPIASPDDPFQGDFVVNGLISSNNVIYASGGNSDNWNSVYSSVCTTSANWNSVYSSVNAASANWNSTYNTVQSNSGIWIGVSSINSLSGGLQIIPWGSNILIDSDPSTKTIKISAKDTIGGGGGGDPSCCSVVVANSGNWNSTHTTVRSNSAKWEGTYTTVKTNSAMWGYNEFLNFNPHVGFEQENYYPIYSSNINTTYNGVQYFVKDSRDRDFIFYHANPGPSKGNILYKAIISPQNKIYLNSIPVLNNSDKYESAILRFEPNYAILRTSPLSAGYSRMFYGGASACKYTLYEFPESNFSTFDMDANKKDITYIIDSSFPDENFNYDITIDMQFISHKNDKFILKTCREGRKDFARTIKMSLWKWDSTAFVLVGNEVTIFSDRGDPNETLFFLETSILQGQTFHDQLTSYMGDYHITPTLREGNPQTNLFYIPTYNTILGTTSYRIEGYNASLTPKNGPVLKSLIAMHFNTPVDFLETGFTDVSDLTPLHPRIINIADESAWINIFNDDNSPNWAGHNLGGSEVFKANNYKYLYDDVNKRINAYIQTDQQNLIYNFALTGISWDTFTFNLTTNDRTNKYITLPMLTPYDLRIQSGMLLLSSNFIVFPCWGLKKDFKPSTGTEGMSFQSAEILVERPSIMTSTEPIITAHSINMKAGTLTPFKFMVNDELKEISPNILQTFEPNQVRQVFSTTIDQNNQISYYVWASGADKIIKKNEDIDRTDYWPIYKIFPVRDDTETIIASGIEDRKLYNPCSPNNINKLNSIDVSMKPYLTSCYIRSWGISGDNTILLVHPDSGKNVDLGESWNYIQRMMIYNGNEFHLAPTPCMSATFKKVLPEKNLKFYGNIMVDLTDNVMYYSTRYSPEVVYNGVRDLNTYEDIFESGEYVIANRPVTFGALCATDLNLGKYVAVDSDVKFLGVQIHSENNPNPSFNLPNPQTFNQIITSLITSHDKRYMHVFSKNQIPGLIAYVFDYPLFLGGRYHTNPIEYAVIPLEANQPEINIYLEFNEQQNKIEVKPDIKFKGDTYQRIRIAQIETDNVGIKNIKYFPINGFDPGTTLNQYSVQTGPVSTFKGTTTFEASSTDMFLKVNVNGKEYGILLWELP